MISYIAIGLALDLADDTKGAMAYRGISIPSLHPRKPQLRTNLLQDIVLVVLRHGESTAKAQKTCNYGMLRVWDAALLVGGQMSEMLW